MLGISPLSPTLPTLPTLPPLYPTLPTPLSQPELFLDRQPFQEWNPAGVKRMAEIQDVVLLPIAH